MLHRGLQMYENVWMAELDCEGLREAEGIGGAVENDGPEKKRKKRKYVRI
jgi:hypothetical protein